MKELKINVDKGLTFNGNKLTLSVSDSSLISKEPDGLWVGNLSGSNGTAGGSTVDGHTVYEYMGTDDNGNPLKKIDISRSKVQHIFTMCAYTVSSHSSLSPYVTCGNTTVKTVQNIINEANYPLGFTGGCTSYFMQVGDLLMLKSTPTGSVVTNAIGTPQSGTEDGNRYAGDKCLGLFYISKISYYTSNPFKIASMTMVQLYADSKITGTYKLGKGKSYSGVASQ